MLALGGNHQPLARRCHFGKASGGLICLILAMTGVAFAAYTEPRLALLRVTPLRSGAAISLRIEGSFSFPDVVQLGMPLQIVVTQPTLTARFDLNGNVFTSANGAPEQPAAGPGIISVAAREVVLALPPGFTTAATTIQAVATYEGKIISSNRLTVNL